MKLLKRMAVLGLAVLALSACTKSSEESETVTGNEVDPAKQSAMRWTRRWPVRIIFW